MSKHDEKPCPNCGHCPTCGKSNWKPQPWPYGRFYPNQYYPYPTTSPYFWFSNGGNSPNQSTSGGTIQATYGAN